MVGCRSDGWCGRSSRRASHSDYFEQYRAVMVSDEDYSHFAYQNHVIHFLLESASDAELQRVLKHCCEEKERERAK